MRLLMGCLLWLLATAVLAQSERPLITLAADIWCPYNCDPQSAKPGYVVELAQLVFERAGYRVEYLVLPWARTLQSVEQGVITAAIGATAQELPSALFPQQEVGRFRGHLITARSMSWRYLEPASLKGMRIGVVNSYDYGSFNRFIERNRDSDLLQVLSGQDAINRGLAMVARRRLDAFIEDRDVAAYTITQMELEQQLVVGDPVGSAIKLYIAFSSKLPQSKQYAQVLNDGIVALRASGELAQILNRYGIKDWNP